MDPLNQNPGSLRPGCHNLDYSQFQVPTGRSQPSELNERTHIVGAKHISISAKKGCKLCSMIYQGITFFWEGLRENEHVVDDGSKRTDHESTGNDKRYRDYLRFRLIPGKPLQLMRSESEIEERFNNTCPTLEFYTEFVCLPVHPAFGIAPKVPTFLGPVRCKHCCNSGCMNATHIAVYAFHLEPNYLDDFFMYLGRFPGSLNLET
ncbi:hypothetical protein GQ44DRAFT_161810 [Phaeosphaeriaceae sp. PMI808]|nr:hypothetical protein GQ44DRAFT_161810 [Phaeosphaeriaceae sp. PMI808]